MSVVRVIGRRVRGGVGECFGHIRVTQPFYDTKEKRLEFVKPTAPARSKPIIAGK